MPLLPPVISAALPTRRPEAEVEWVVEETTFVVVMANSQSKERAGQPEDARSAAGGLFVKWLQPSVEVRSTRSVPGPIRSFTP